MYKQLIESLLYLVNTRTNICFAVNALSQYMIETRHAHWIAVKHVLRYLCGTIGYGLRYVSCGDVKLRGYTNSDWAGSAMDQKSTFGCCFSLGSGMISWLSRKQTSISLSTSEVEYITPSMESRGVVWLRKLLDGIFDLDLEPTLIHCDNKSCVKISKNPIFHVRSKNIDIKYNYI